MRVLVACESSGTVRDAFARLGHDAWSCDLLPSESPGQHVQGDASAILGDGWDLLVAHPPCTYLAVSGMHWTVRGLRDSWLTEHALDLVRRFMLAPVPRICIENPVSIISTRIRRPDQIIQPYQFGENASKRTCLWLKNLPPLAVDPADYVAPRITADGKRRWANQTDSGQNRQPPSEDRWKIRSVTYPGIAAAMAAQWGSLGREGMQLEFGAAWT